MMPPMAWLRGPVLPRKELFGTPDHRERSSVFLLPSWLLSDSALRQNKVLQGYSYDHAYPKNSIHITAIHSTLAAVCRFLCMKEQRGTSIRVSLLQHFWVFRLDCSLLCKTFICILGDFAAFLASVVWELESEVTWLIAVRAVWVSTGNRSNK